MRWPFSRERERKLESELQFHLEQQIRDNIAAGMTPEEARRRAVIEFGGLEQTKELCRDERRLLWLEQTWQDCRYALRQLAKTPGFTVIAVLTLALGIGATTAIFSVANSVLLKPLPYPGSERLVHLRELRLPNREPLRIAPANFRDWSRQTTDVFESMYAESGRSFNLTGSGDPILVVANRVTHPFFETLRSPPMLGRVFGPEEEQPGKNQVAVLTNGFWLRQFGGRPDVIGETIRLDGQSYTVIGVMSPDFQRGGSRDLLTPLALTEQEWANRSVYPLASYARLKPGVTLEQAQARMDVIAAQLAQQHPATNRNSGVAVMSILESRVGTVRPLMLSLVGAVSLLLLIACTNVANLLLARATAREREICVRVALGATRGRIARQFLVESLVLASLGALLGLLVAKGGLALLLAYAPPALPRGDFEIVLDGRALLVTVAVALLTGLGFGLAPVIQSARVNLSGALKQGGRGETGDQRNLTRNGLIVAEIALALVLLAGAGLLIRSFIQIAKFDPGFNPRGTLVLGIFSPGQKYPTPEKQAALVDALVERFRRVPGVTGVAASQVLPLSGADFARRLEIEGRVDATEAALTVNHFAATPDYFQTMGIRLLRGRAFDERDRLGATAVAIISQSAADRFFSGADPIGRRIAFGGNPKIWREVVGVAADVKSYDLEREAWPQTYTPFAQTPFNAINLIVRTGPEVPPAATLRREVYAVDPDQPVARLIAFEELLMRAFTQQQFAMMLFVTFSVIALLLAMVGIYGVMAFSVSRRTSEFGVRLALGARPGDVLCLILGQASRLVLWGIVVGIAGALMVGRFMRSFLYQIPPHDPIVFVTIAALLLLVALLASLVPARRATKVNPLIALRAE